MFMRLARLQSLVCTQLAKEVAPGGRVLHAKLLKIELRFHLGPQPVYDLWLEYRRGCF